MGATLRHFLRGHRATVINGWKNALRARPEAGLHAWPVLAEQLPPLLDHLITMTDSLCSGTLPTVPLELADSIACERLRQGYDAGALIQELAALRDCIVQQWLQAQPTHLGPGMRILNLALDRVVGASVERYVVAQNRILQSLDEVCAGTLEGDLRECLQNLLAVLSNACASVDTAAILLSDGAHLRVEAAVGLDQEVTDEVCIPMGRGFSGLVAAGRAAVTLDAAGIDRLVLSPALRHRGLRALYGLPLVHEGEVIGVSHIGSLHAVDFSDQDKQIFAAMAYRAAAAIAQHLLQQVLLEHNAQLARAKHVAEQIVGIVSHDLRSPITAISLNTESLLRQGPSATARTALERIRHSTQRAERMITDLLDLTRARMGTGLPMHPAPMDLLAVAVQVVQEQREVHPQSQFILHSQGDLEGVWDCERLAQVFSNLLHNAARYGSEQAAITLALRDQGASVMLTVHNRGAPIPSESLAHLFEPMWRGVDGRRKGEGVGLGLFIVDSIVRGHGGLCEVQSSAADGTTFCITLPRTAPKMALDSEEQSH